MAKENEYLKAFLVKKNLRVSSRRDLILEAFIKEEGHVSAEELYNKVVRKDDSIGLSTVYRALKLFYEAGLANRRQFGDGEAKYEHAFSHKHHDHLICECCGNIIEFANPDIEKLQIVIAEKHNFIINTHKLELYGTCSKCQDSASKG